MYTQSSKTFDQAEQKHVTTLSRFKRNKLPGKWSLPFIKKACTLYTINNWYIKITKPSIWLAQITFIAPICSKLLSWRVSIPHKIILSRKSSRSQASRNGSPTQSNQKNPQTLQPEENCKQKNCWQAHLQPLKAQAKSYQSTETETPEEEYSSRKTSLPPIPDHKVWILQCERLDTEAAWSIEELLKQRCFDVSFTNPIYSLNMGKLL